MSYIPYLVCITNELIVIFVLAFVYIYIRFRIYFAIRVEVMYILDGLISFISSSK